MGSNVESKLGTEKTDDKLTKKAEKPKTVLEQAETSNLKAKLE
jgi:hypothetical protein